MKVLIVAGGYLPGFKYGGPVRSLAALVDQLGNECDFSIVTSGSDLGESRPYQDVSLDTWTPVGNADVWYTQARRLSPWFWRKIFTDITPDVVYLNSFMSPVTSAFLFWRRIGLLPRSPAILVPRGELAVSALDHKGMKKRVFRFAAKLLKLHRELTWQASSVAEEADIRRVIGTDANTIIAPALVSHTPSSHTPEIKQPHSTSFCWLGRIAPVKNLLAAISLMKLVDRGNTSLTVYGPIEDGDYWDNCKASVGELPQSTTFEYKGQLTHDEVAPALSSHQFFLFPTLGENFGHVIAEALNQGLPVLVSDQTPWRNLEAAGVGWDIPLDDSEKWTQVLNYCAAMENDEYQAMSARCRKYVEIWMEEHGGRAANLAMFRHVAQNSVNAS